MKRSEPHDESSIIHACISLYRCTFNAWPEVLGISPARVELLGNHTDYNQGYVLSCAVNRFLCVALGRRTDDGRCALCSSQFHGPVITKPGKPNKEMPWVNYPVGVDAVLNDNGFHTGPFNCAIHSTIPSGAGLSSSAALETATALGLSRLFGFTVEPMHLAHLCREAEHRFAGTHCGLLDQFSVLFGLKNKVLLNDFRTNSVTEVSVPAGRFALALVESGVYHTLSDSLYNLRRTECETAVQRIAAINPSVRSLRDISPRALQKYGNLLDETLFNRALHVVEENERVLSAVKKFQNNAMEDVGRLLCESHESSRVHFCNSCPELDFLVSTARKIDGVFGARLTGGGFGGAMLAVVEKLYVESFSRIISRRYQQRYAKPAVVHIVEIADGARGEISSVPAF